MQRLVREPGFAVPLLRGWLVTLWATKGGGFYGLGYVVTLVTLEIYSAEQDATKGASSFATSQAIQYVTGFGVDSILNTVRAAVWPFYLFDWLGLPGIVAFFAAGAVFERVVRPAVEARLPELAEARVQRLQAKQEKRERKRAKRAAKTSAE